MLETVAGVPGMIAAMARHFHSLRKLTRDHGWIHTLLGIHHSLSSPRCINGYWRHTAGGNTAMD